MTSLDLQNENQHSASLDSQVHREDSRGSLVKRAEQSASPSDPRDVQAVEIIILSEY